MCPESLSTARNGWTNQCRLMDRNLLANIEDKFAGTFLDLRSIFAVNVNQPLAAVHKFPQHNAHVDSKFYNGTCFW